MRAFFFDAWEGLLIALRAIGAHRMRSVLTTLGIIIGISAVTAMATVINGIERDFNEELSELGTDVLYVTKWPWVNGPGFKWWEYINRPNIREDLAEAINKRSKYTLTAIPVAGTGRSVRYADKTASGVRIQGSSSDYPLVHTVDLEVGRFYTEVENRSQRNVCVIGAGVAEQLFPIEQPIGKSIRISGEKFQVIGVLKKKGSSSDGPGSGDNEIKIPFNTFKTLFGMRWRSITVEVKLAEGAELEEAKDEITGILRTARKLDALEKDDFEINYQNSLIEQLAPIKTAIYGIGIFLTALALLVGGIGVMNIMFVSVKERTREIGIRKAVGAKRATILTQFLIEAVIVCLIGGLVGVGISLALTALINTVMPAFLPISTIFIALGICVLVGVVFGLAPAWSAAKAEPIAALRYE